jgi:cysteine desulfurase
VLDPLAQIERRGFIVELLAPDAGGAVEADAVARMLRPDTLLVSVMHVNNETGVVQPIEAIADRLAGTGVFLHVDAAQGFGKVLEPLRHARIDLMSVSGHKIHAPQGIGGLIARRRDGARPPLVPLMHGGGQERGLRPGTLPVHLIAGLGLAAELAAAEADQRERRCRAFRIRLLDGLAPLQAVINGDPARSVPHIVNLSIPGIDAEAAIEAWEDLVEVSHGAACTSQRASCSHVLDAMRLAGSREEGALRLSWCHDTAFPDGPAMVDAIVRAREEQESVAR